MGKISVDYSVIIPVFNSSKVLAETHRQVTAAIQSMGKKYEILFVDDNSSDGSLELLKNISSEDNAVRVVALLENYGQYAATCCGVNASKGDVVISLDDDLQYSPAEIKRLLDKFNGSDYAIIFGMPVKRHPLSTNKILPVISRWVFDFMILPGYRGLFYFSSFRVLSKNRLSQFMPKGVNPYFIWEIPRSAVANVTVTHHATARARTNYNYTRLIRFFSVYLHFGIARLLRIISTLFIIAVFPVLVFNGDITMKFLLSFFFIFFCLLAMRLRSVYLKRVESARKPHCKFKELT